MISLLSSCSFGEMMMMWMHRRKSFSGLVVKSGSSLLRGPHCTKAATRMADWLWMVAPLPEQLGLKTGSAADEEVPPLCGVAAMKVSLGALLPDGLCCPYLQLWRTWVWEPL